MRLHAWTATTTTCLRLASRLAIGLCGVLLTRVGFLLTLLGCLGRHLATVVRRVAILRSRSIGVATLSLPICLTTLTLLRLVKAVDRIVKEYVLRLLRSLLQVRERLGYLATLVHLYDLLSPLYRYGLRLFETLRRQAVSDFAR